MNKPRFVRSSVIGKLTNKHTIHLLCTGLTIIWWWVEPGIVCNLKLKHMHTLSRARDERELPPSIARVAQQSTRLSLQRSGVGFQFILLFTHSASNAIPFTNFPQNSYSSQPDGTTRIGQIPASTSRMVYKNFCNNCVFQRLSAVYVETGGVYSRNAFL